MEFINRLYNKVIFSDASELNVSALDMGEEQCKVTFQDPVVNRLKVATGTIGSLSIFVSVKMTVSIKKTSPIISAWRDRVLSNAYIGGSVTVYDDANRSYTATEPSINLADLGAWNGSDPQITFEIDANLKVNRQALAGFGV